MKRFLKLMALSAVALLASGPLQAGEGSTKDEAKKKVSPAFQKLQSLAGAWKGTSPKEDGSGVENVEARYRVTSGGTAVEEVLFPGTPHEMVSVYFQDGDTVKMTHYCMIGNQPRLQLSSSKGKTLHFDFVDATNMKSPSDPHMGALTLTMKDKDHLVQDWAFMAGGEKKGNKRIDLTRVD